MLAAPQGTVQRAFDTPNALPAAERKVRISIRGKLGFASWKAIFEGRKLALQEGLALQVEVGDCDSADMAGISALLVAIDKLGEIELVGCTELSRYWFSNLGVCRGCRNDDSPVCPKRLRRQAE